MGRWRAATLLAIHLLFVAHFVHWKLAGRTLAPLELNEVMYTLELGIVTAGFIFMAALVLGTMIFGRFFCSWGCHILALQDGCAWMLRKIGITRKPIRSRLLLLVPPLTALYMFVWPHIVRTWQRRPFPGFHLAEDTDGWASFITTDFLRNLPGLGITVLTFLTCGFAMIYLLGSRTFCTYVCPYGAIFGLADRFAVGRIRLTGDCKQCGLCTATCTSGIRVHEEIANHGGILNSACLKDLDCVKACPQEAIQYQFGKPRLAAFFQASARFGSLRYDFSLREEFMAGAVFLFVLLSFRGLYGSIPFLLSLTFGGMAAYVAVIAGRMFSRANVLFASLSIKNSGQVNLVGKIFLGSSIAIAVFVGHCAFIRWHEFHGLRQRSHLSSKSSAVVHDYEQQMMFSAYKHLSAAKRWGLFPNLPVERALFDVSQQLGKFDSLRASATVLLDRLPQDAPLRLRWAKALAGKGLDHEAKEQIEAILSPWHGTANPPPIVAASYRVLGTLLQRGRDYPAAAAALKQAIEADPTQAPAWAELGEVLAELGEFDHAINALKESLRIDEKQPQAYYNLGTLLAHRGLFKEAIASYRRAESTGLDDEELHNNLGFAFLRTGDWDRAGYHLNRALLLNPNSAAAHFNLGRWHALARRDELAAEHKRRAASLDARYKIQPSDRSPD